MIEVISVVIGGGLGALARWLASTLLGRLAAGRFPLGTLFVNLAGAFLIGFLSPFFRKEILTHRTQLLLVTGFLGGFTTFSSYMLECVMNLEAGQTARALLYIGASTVFGLLLVAVGIYAGRAVVARM